MQQSMFQSSPDPKPGATGWTAIIYGEVDVPILTRPEGRALPSISLERWGLGCSNPHPTRRPGATPPTISADSLGVFQSSPDPKAGRYLETRRLGRLRKSSNPHPTRRPGATTPRLISTVVVGRVPILTRPEGRALRAVSAIGSSTGHSNPHPTRRPALRGVVVGTQQP